MHAIVIGSGFAGLSAATSLAHAGWQVTLVEKNDQVGGRARVLRDGGFTFDMGPSWYWMPEVFERYFARFGKKVGDLYDLVRLDPSYQVVFGPNEHWNIPARMPDLKAFFEQVETGAAASLERFLDEARMKYDLGMSDLVYRPALSWSEFANAKVLSGMLRASVLTSLRKHVARYFKDSRLRQLMEFPVLFLGATPQDTPALYSLMNYADMALGTWYPMGGMGRVVDALSGLAREQGVDIRLNFAATRIIVEDGSAVGVQMGNTEVRADVVVASSDYHHTEQALLAPDQRSYNAAYWKDRVLAPSSLLFFMGFDRQFPKLLHHNLFFDESLDQHAKEIYTAPKWPTRPLLYTSCPSRTDRTVAPQGCENVVALIPVAPGLTDTPEVRAHYQELVLDRLTAHTGIDVRRHLIVRHDYGINDFTSDYNSFRGNAYGLANTLRQTAVLKPRMKSRKVKGLYFAGQLTVPGPGVPPSLISGQVVADLIIKETRTLQTHA
jgi:phytoene desaturase